MNNCTITIVLLSCIFDSIRQSIVALSEIPEPTTSAQPGEMFQSSTKESINQNWGG